MNLRCPAILFACVTACSASAVPYGPSDWRLSQFNRSVWQIEDGLPHNYVTAMVTDEEGYLLLGTQSGIVRFDGRLFLPFEPFSGMWIYALLKASDGSLWVGSQESGLHVLRNGRIQSWSKADGITNGTVHSLLEDRAHNIWAVCGDALLKIDQGRPRVIVRGENVDGYSWQSMTEDDTGSIWFAAKQGLFRVTGDSVKKVALRGVKGLPTTIYNSAATHQLYFGTTTGLYTLQCALDECAGRAMPEVGGPVVKILASADGAVWVGTWGKGIYRSDGRRVEQFSTQNGLADDFVRMLREDREHNLWVGTRSGGLTRFRKTMIKPVGIPEGLGGNYASAVTGDGADGLWLGTWRSGLFHWRNGNMTPQPLPKDSLGVIINALALDNARDLWVGTYHGLWRIGAGRATAERIPLPRDDQTITSILIARDRTLWLAQRDFGLMEFSSGSPLTSRAVVSLPGKTVAALLEDGEGRIWIGANDGLWRMTQHHTLERLADGPVTAIAQDFRGRVWVAGAQKIQVYSPTGPRSLQFAGLPAAPVYIIVSDGQSGIWLGTERGLVRASMDDVEEFLAGRSARVDLVGYGVSDGMRTIACRIGAQPSSWRRADGSIWLPTAKGFVEIDPMSKERPAPPHAWITQILVDGKLSHDGPVRLLPGSHDLAVSFSAIRFGGAERVQFRYRLRGLDQDWVEAGGERVVRYNNLRPGPFALLVSARDPAGAWSDPVSSVTIQQLPFLYQTVWFRALGAAAIAGLIVALYRFRLRSVRQRYRAVLEERNRIAREWHDTLLAGLSAVSWQLDVAEKYCQQPPVLSTIAAAKGMLRYCRDEARRAISDLRHEHVVETSLADSLRQAIGQLTDGSSVRPRFEIEGRPTCSNSELNSDLLRIGQEAAANALLHAHASELVVRLDYRDGKIALSVQDDGVGMDPASLDNPPHGHYGLLGMRERAQRFGGDLYVSSEPGRGTVVKAVVPCEK